MATTIRSSVRLLRLVININTGVLLMGVAMVLSAMAFPVRAGDNNPAFYHWPPGHHRLSLVDRTADPAWHQAITDAVTTWDKAGADLELSVRTAAGPCHQRRDEIQICLRDQYDLTTTGLPGEQGLVERRVGSADEFHSVIVLVCTGCGLDEQRRIVIATHEIGHSLGLIHSIDPGSVMYPTGGSAQPDTADYAALRSKSGTARPHN